MKTASILSLLVLILAACGGDGATSPPLPENSVSDDFERATLGPNWVVQFGSPAIIGGSDLGVTTAARGVLGWRGDFGSDQFSEAVLSDGFNGLDGIQVTVRMDSVSSARYGFLYRSDSLRYQLKYDGVNPGQVLVAVTRPAPQPGDVLRIEVRGNELRGLVNGVVLLEATHGTLTSGIPGIAMAAFSGVVPARIWESWRGGALP